MERPMLDHLFAGLTKKQKLALAKRDAREINYVLNDADGNSMYDASFRAELFRRCDQYAKKAG